MWYLVNENDVDGKGLSSMAIIFDEAFAREPKSLTAHLFDSHRA